MGKLGRSPLLQKEDYWAVWLGLGLILTAFLVYLTGHSLTSSIAVAPPSYAEWSQLGEHLAARWASYVALYVVFTTVFACSLSVMGHDPQKFIAGFSVLFLASFVILAVTENEWAREHEFNYALVALALGLLVGNLMRLPDWLSAALRTEYYIKTGIVMLGATLPMTLIAKAGPIAFVQATIVSLVTWGTIFLVATRLFGLDRRFAAVMGAGGAVCGVSASIAVGGAVKAEKEHIAITISIVTIAALIMIFVLPVLSNALGLHPAVAGAWIGNSEFADAAGLAAAEAIRADGEAAIRAFTLVKVIGRDIWVGIWAFVLALVSVIWWERSTVSQRPGAGVIWERFPKFVMGFFAASIFISVVSALAGSEGYDQEVKPLLIAPIKELRTWTFCFTFLCIGLTTRFKELTKFGVKPLWAFTLGVAVNVPLGYILSQYVFGDYWRQIH